MRYKRVKEILLTGIDVGSTTTKIAAINPEKLFIRIIEGIRQLRYTAYMMP